jgi:hypothetical protein
MVLALERTNGTRVIYDDDSEDMTRNDMPHLTSGTNIQIYLPYGMDQPLNYFESCSLASCILD